MAFTWHASRSVCCVPVYAMSRLPPAVSFHWYRSKTGAPPFTHCTMAAERMSTAAMAYPAMAYPVAESAHGLSLDELTDCMMQRTFFTNR